MKQLLLTIIILFSLQFVSGQTLVNEYLYLILDCTENSEHVQAIKICDKLVTYKPDCFYAYYLRGLNHYLVEDYKDAIQDFDTSVKLNPDFSDAYIQRAKAKSKSKNFMGAMADYNRARNDKFYETVSSLAGDIVWSLFAGKKEKKVK